MTAPLRRQLSCTGLNMLWSVKVRFSTIIVTVFSKTDLMVTNTEICFFPVDESRTHALSRDTKH